MICLIPVLKHFTLSLFIKGEVNKIIGKCLLNNLKLLYIELTKVFLRHSLVLLALSSEVVSLEILVVPIILAVPVVALIVSVVLIISIV